MEINILIICTLKWNDYQILHQIIKNKTQNRIQLYFKYDALLIIEVY